MQQLFNLHTHHPLPEGETSIRNCGLHPWHTTADYRRTLALFLGPLPFPGSDEPQLLQAIGECGLDRLCQTPYDLQMSAFKAQIGESEMRRLPMIIHCVKAFDDIIALHATATQPWVIHGFRGKPQQLQQLTAQGFYISFGIKHNSESLAQCPAERLFLETDDEKTAIVPLYERAAATRNTDVETLATQIWSNARAIFDNL